MSIRTMASRILGAQPIDLPAPPCTCVVHDLGRYGIGTDVETRNPPSRYKRIDNHLCRVHHPFTTGDKL